MFLSDLWSDWVLLELIFSFIASFSFALLFNAPKNQLFYCGLAGMFGWLIYYLLSDFSIPKLVVIFLSTVGVTLFSRILSRIRKQPFTIFIVSGIVPLVPGSGVYTAMYSAISGDATAATLMGVNSVKLTGAIGMGILIILALPGRWFEIFTLYEKNV